jgi:hypothetical protein
LKTERTRRIKETWMDESKGKKVKI